MEYKGVLIAIFDEGERLADNQKVRCKDCGEQFSQDLRIEHPALNILAQKVEAIKAYNKLVQKVRSRSVKLEDFLRQRNGLMKLMGEPLTAATVVVSVQCPACLLQRHLDAKLWLPPVETPPSVTELMHLETSKNLMHLVARDLGRPVSGFYEDEENFAYYAERVATHH